MPQVNHVFVLKGVMCWLESVLSLISVLVQPGVLSLSKSILSLS